MSLRGNDDFGLDGGRGMMGVMLLYRYIVMLLYCNIVIMLFCYNVVML